MLNYLDGTILSLQGSAAVSDGVASRSAMEFILPLIVSIVLSMIVIPIMVRIAPIIGMIDKPDPRKIHASPVPRVGGTGIFIGTIVPIVLLLPMDGTIAAYIAGSAILFCFGVLDDCRELGHYVKFIGQFVAVIFIVYFGDVYVYQLPFLDGALSADVGKPFTVFAMVGMINAINHSDGLDGLAGGESLISLSCIAWLSYLGGGEQVMIIAIAAIGGLLGFMRFNAHPARIFMGDGGSQFLGYTLGFLAILLTQQVNVALSPALPLLFLGLPIADIIAVFAQRIYHRVNWFRATRNHIHHRLLALGFQHYESVVIIYSIQALLVGCAAVMAYEADIVILMLYLAVVTSVFLMLYLAERRGVRLNTNSSHASLDRFIETARHSRTVENAAWRVVYYGVSFFLVAGSLVATQVPADFSLFALVLFVATLLLVVTGRLWLVAYRVLSYITVVFVVFLSSTYQPEFLAGEDFITYLFFGMLVGGIVLTIRMADRGEFSITPTDFLVILAVIILAISSGRGIVSYGTTATVLKSIILFYGCELILNRITRHLNIFMLSILASLLIVGLRGFY